VDRRRTALVLLLLFIVCLGVATVLSGSRPGLQQGIAPTVAAVVGYLFAFVAAVLLIVPAAEDQGSMRTLGVVILGAAARRAR
jgi:quinol-cytochrome oxidoreductase complex cytochrome b subunit